MRGNFKKDQHWNLKICWKSITATASSLWHAFDLLCFVFSWLLQRSKEETAPFKKHKSFCLREILESMETVAYFFIWSTIQWTIAKLHMKTRPCRDKREWPLPIASMYGIFTYMYDKNQPFMYIISVPCHYTLLLQVLHEKLTWNLKITPLEMYLNQISILWFHINFRGCFHQLKRAKRTAKPIWTSSSMLIFLGVYFFLWVVVWKIFFIFIPVWGNDPIWLIFFKWVGSTTNYFLCSQEVPEENLGFVGARLTFTCQFLRHLGEWSLMTPWYPGLAESGWLWRFKHLGINNHLKCMKLVKSDEIPHINLCNIFSSFFLPSIYGMVWACRFVVQNGKG